MGFVPTMGALHAGHLSLIEKSIEQCNHTVVSIFVNKKQFAPDEDFDDYPRTLKEDLEALKKLRVDVLFLPDNNLIYPKNYSTYVEEISLSDGLESNSRPHFFRGVLTVVLKLLNIVSPNCAYFGKKDIQQLKLVEKMVQDLNLDIKIVPGKTVREKNGLAMSSRNQYLSKKTYADLKIIYATLLDAKDRIGGGEKTSSIIKKEIKEQLLSLEGLKIDYIEITDARFLSPIEKIDQNIIISLAVFVTGIRLIDNIEIAI